MIDGKDLSDYIRQCVTRECGDIVKRVRARDVSSPGHDYVLQVEVSYDLVGWRHVFDNAQLNPDRVAADAVLDYLCGSHAKLSCMVEPGSASVLAGRLYNRRISLCLMHDDKGPRMDPEAVGHPAGQNLTGVHVSRNL